MSKAFIPLLLCFACAISGCTTVVVGGAATAGVIAISQDFATTTVDVNFNQAWKVANAQLRKLGVVDETHKKLGEVKAIVDKTNVTVRISRLADNVVDIKVTARKNLLPDLRLARAILANIIRNL